MRTLIEPPTAHAGSLGDEALIRGALASVDGPADVITEPDCVALWKSVLPDVNVVSWANFNDYSRFVLVGADCVDGAYGPPPFGNLEMAIRAGLECRVVSFSLGERPSNWDGYLRLYAQMGVVFYPRDGISFQRFRERVGIEPQMGGDLSLMLDSPEPYKSGYILIVPVAGATAPCLPPGPVVVMSHDLRSDSQAAATMFHSIRATRDCRLAIPTNAREAKRIAAGAEFGISWRLHGALACLSAGVPCVGIERNGKFAGIYRDFGVPSLVSDKRQLARVTLDGYANRDRHRLAIAAAIPALRGAARSQCR